MEGPFSVRWRQGRSMGPDVTTSWSVRGDQSVEPPPTITARTAPCALRPASRSRSSAWAVDAAGREAWSPRYADTDHETVTAPGTEPGGIDAPRRTPTRQLDGWERPLAGDAVRATAEARLVVAAVDLHRPRDGGATVGAAAARSIVGGRAGRAGRHARAGRTPLGGMRHVAHLTGSIRAQAARQIGGRVVDCEAMTPPLDPLSPGAGRV